MPVKPCHFILWARTAAWLVVAFGLVTRTVAAGEPDLLAVAAKGASTHLRNRQNSAGYWLTTYTSSRAFDHPHLEMNTFLTSMMVEFLAPIAEPAGLKDNVAKARAHLARQIEKNGLVRYHGRPDSPTIPSLGCVITPDSDDTALVWSVAGSPNSALIPGVLKILQSYRTPKGLYRTWLAPRRLYLNLDPGEDPNPTDIGIQMDLLMFFATYDPPDAGPLFRALQPAMSDEGNWIYYKEAPLIPCLQQANLARMGFPLRGPPHRVAESIPGQASWLAMGRMLAPYLASAGPAPSGSAARGLLLALAEGDFAALRHTPPLLYHNDLTAQVRRFYWSEDFGYALWLRLYLEVASRP